MPRNHATKKPKPKTSGHSGRRWLSSVKTVSTFPPEGLFTKDPQTIANKLADNKVSPKGIGSGIRMVQYFINRGGKGLSPTRRKKLKRAKEILHEKLERQKCRAPTSP